MRRGWASSLTTESDCCIARMTARNPTIIATSIGFQPTGQGAMDWRLGPAYGLAASLARAGEAPRVCIVSTAVRDAGDVLLAIYAAFGRAGWRASHLALFPQPNVPDIQEHLLAQDVIWVAGGSVANLLALWRLHGDAGARWRSRSYVQLSLPGPAAGAAAPGPARLLRSRLRRGRHRGRVRRLPVHRGLLGRRRPAERRAAALPDCRPDIGRRRPARIGALRPFWTGYLAVVRTSRQPCQ